MWIMIIICYSLCFSWWDYFIFLTILFKDVIFCGTTILKQHIHHNTENRFSMSCYYNFNNYFVSVFCLSIIGLYQIVLKFITCYNSKLMHIIAVFLLFFLSNWPFHVLIIIIQIHNLLWYDKSNKNTANKTMRKNLFICHLWV